MALSCRCSLLSSLSDDMDPSARVLFIAAIDGDRTTTDLERRRFIDLRNTSRGVPILVASCRNQRLAAPRGLESRLWHSNRQCRYSVPTPPSHFSNSGVPRRSHRRLSRQRGIVPRRLQRNNRKHRVEIRLAGVDGYRLANSFRACLALHPDFPNTRLALIVAPGDIS